MENKVLLLMRYFMLLWEVDGFCWLALEGIIF